MKIAVLSDIHGNLGALDAVIAHAVARGVDTFVNLGDICSGALMPRETADRLMALNWPTIRGNHERQVLDQAIDAQGPSDRHAAVSLRPDQLAWLRGLPQTLWLNDDVLMVHGTPDSDVVYFLETVTAEGLRAATPEEIDARAAGIDAPIILCGHSHTPRIHRRTCARRGATHLLDQTIVHQLIVNPGSVGLPAYDARHPYPHVVENRSPHARYAIVSNDTGYWEAVLHAVAYDWEYAARLADANNRPGWAQALRTGLV